MMLYKNFCIIVVFYTNFFYGLSEPVGKYCGNIFGNDLDINFKNTTKLADITASIYRNNYQCLDEKYIYESNNQSIILSSDPDDCLNLILEKYHLCPCPPSIKYNLDYNQIVRKDTDIGDIILNKC